MIDSGSSADFKPSATIKRLGRDVLDYLFITNADQDHMSDLQGLWHNNILVSNLYRNPSYTGEQMRAIKRRGGPLSDDAQRYTNACESYNQAVTEPFDTHMGGIRAKTIAVCFFTNTGLRCSSL